MLSGHSFRASFFFPQQIGNAGNFFVRNSLFLHVLDLVFSDAAANRPLTGLRKLVLKSLFHRQKPRRSFGEASFLPKKRQARTIHQKCAGIAKNQSLRAFQKPSRIDFPSQTRSPKGEVCATWKKRRSCRNCFFAFGCARLKNSLWKNNR